MSVEESLMKSLRTKYPLKNTHILKIEQQEFKKKKSYYVKYMIQFQGRASWGRRIRSLSFQKNSNSTPTYNIL